MKLGVKLITLGIDGGENCTFIAYCISIDEFIEHGI